VPVLRAKIRVTQHWMEGLANGGRRGGRHRQNLRPVALGAAKHRADRLLTMHDREAEQL
jgi:hypothetical protein